MFVSRFNFNFRKYLHYCDLNKLSFRSFGTEIPIIYGDMASPPVRFVMMTASLLNVDVKLHNIDLFYAENKSKFYTKITPLQKVPVMSVGGQFIRDSHAIALYLCSISSIKDLYPKNKLHRAKIDEFLYYNSGTLFPIDSAIYTGYFAGLWPADETKVNSWFSALDYLNTTLSNQPMLTGSEVRLCDICCAATVTSLGMLLPLQERHDHIEAWLNKLKVLPCFEINDAGLKRLEYFVSLIKQKRS